MGSLQCAALIWPFLLEDCEVEVFTDVSDAGWGIYSSPFGRTRDWTTSSHLAPSSWHFSASPSCALLLSVLGCGGGVCRFFLISSRPQFCRSPAQSGVFAHYAVFLASLQVCFATTMRLGVYDQRPLFFPSRLSKMDCPDHLGPPILVRHSLAATSLSAPLPLFSPYFFRRCRLRRFQSYCAGPFGALVSLRLLAPRATFLSQTPLLVVLASPTVWRRATGPASVHSFAIISDLRPRCDK